MTRYYTVLAIDPGPEYSAFVIWDGKQILDKGIYANGMLVHYMDCDNIDFNFKIHSPSYHVIEKIASLGMPVGATVFETVFWTGVFARTIGLMYCSRIPRMEVKMHLCNSSRAKDSNIRQALIDRFGAPGTKKEPGLTYGLKKDLWQAFALAVTFYDQRITKELK